DLVKIMKEEKNMTTYYPATGVIVDTHGGEVGEIKIPDVETEIRSISGYEAVFVPRKTREGFEVCGVNTNDLIGQLATLDGIDMLNLERRLRAERVLGDDDSFRSTLLRDNATILSNDLTHQEASVATMIAGYLYLHNGVRVLEFPDGVKYRIRAGDDELGNKVSPMPGEQGTPPAYKDKISGSGYVEITDIDTGERTRVHAFTAFMIYRWGFWEGDNVGQYRPNIEIVMKLAKAFKSID
ncbi:hypothetical protein KJ918_07325, partial [Patescibacteria group bacterium]|nr:hypothetical protein [Patescibacteria group bacterium]